MFDDDDDDDDDEGHSNPATTWIWHVTV